MRSTCPTLRLPHRCPPSIRSDPIAVRVLRRRARARTRAYARTRFNWKFAQRSARTRAHACAIVRRPSGAPLLPVRRWCSGRFSQIIERNYGSLKCMRHARARVTKKRKVCTFVCARAASPANGKKSKVRVVRVVQTCTRTVIIKMVHVANGAFFCIAIRQGCFGRQTVNDVNVTHENAMNACNSDKCRFYTRAPAYTLDVQLSTCLWRIDKSARAHHFGYEYTCTFEFTAHSLVACVCVCVSACVRVR